MWRSVVRYELRPGDSLRELGCGGDTVRSQPHPRVGGFLDRAVAVHTWWELRGGEAQGKSRQLKGGWQMPRV